MWNIVDVQRDRKKELPSIYKQAKNAKRRDGKRHTKTVSAANLAGNVALNTCTNMLSESV